MNVLFVDRGKTFNYLKPIVESMPDITLEHRETVDEALAYLRNHEVSCVITALDLPDFTGIYLAEQIRQVDSDMPVIIFTHYKNNDIIEGIKTVKAVFWDKTFILAQPYLFGTQLKEVLRKDNEAAHISSDKIYSREKLKRYNSIAFPTSSEIET